MFDKKTALITLLAVLSVAAGGAFGLLDIFGFVDGRHGLSLAFFGLSILIIYFAIITIFILNFAEPSKIAVSFVGVAILFGVTFFLMNLNLVLSIFATLLYFAFLQYAFGASRQRSQNQIVFTPQDIFLPVLRNGILYFLILTSAIAFAQSRQLISKNSLVHPTLIRTISRPAVYTLNKQLNSQIQNQLAIVPEELRQQEGNEPIVRLMLSKTVEAMAQNKTGEIYGFKPEEIPIQLARVDSSGEVDIEPVIDGMLPSIAIKLNLFVQKYAFAAPFAIALLTFLILQPLMLPINIIESAITLLLFKVLLATRFIKIEKQERAVDTLHL